MPTNAAVIGGIERHRSQRKKLSRMKRLLLRHRADTVLATAATAMERAEASVAAAGAALESISSQCKVWGQSLSETQLDLFRLGNRACPQHLYPDTEVGHCVESCIFAM